MPNILSSSLSSLSHLFSSISIHIFLITYKSMRDTTAHYLAAAKGVEQDIGVEGMDEVEGLHRVEEGVGGN